MSCHVTDEPLPLLDRDNAGSQILMRSITPILIVLLAAVIRGAFLAVWQQRLVLAYTEPTTATIATAGLEHPRKAKKGEGDILLIECFLRRPPGLGCVGPAAAT